MFFLIKLISLIFITILALIPIFYSIFLCENNIKYLLLLVPTVLISFIIWYSFCCGISDSKTKNEIFKLSFLKLKKIFNNVTETITGAIGCAIIIAIAIGIFYLLGPTGVIILLLILLLLKN